MPLLSAFREASFREKSAWAMAAILTATGVIYFDRVITLSMALGETAPPDMHLVIYYVVMVVIASIIVTSIIAGSYGKEANAPADERERIIQNKAGNWSGYVLAAPVVGALWHYSVNDDGNMLFHLVFLSLVVSHVAEYVFQIFLFRRGV